MHRRRILAASGTALGGLGGLGALAGCLDVGDPEAGDDGRSGADAGSDDAGEDGVGDEDNDGTDDLDPTEFEQCGRLIVSDDEFPAPAREELTAAADGGYETTEEPFVPNMIDVDVSYVRIDGGTHRIRVEREADRVRLTAEETIPSRGARSVRLDNRTDADLTASLTVVRNRDDETVVDAVADLPAGENDSVGEAFEREFGGYEATVAVEPANDTVGGDEEIPEWGEETIGWREEEFTMPFEGVELRPEEPVSIPRAVLEPVDCRGVWELH